MRNAPALLLLTLLAAAPATAQEWTPLRLPSLCSPGPDEAPPAPLYDGSHLLLPADDVLHGEGRGGAPLPAALLLQLLEEDARRRGSDAELHRTAPPFLVRGSDEEVAVTRGILEDLDRAGDELTVKLEVVLEPRFSTTPPAADAADGVERYETRVLSGRSAWFGERSATTYLGDYMVEVASDSGAAEPILGAALTGRTVHLTAQRSADGSRVQVFGVLDLAELAGLETFDPGTSDLGAVQQPVVRTVQLHFAGVVESGGWLRAAVRGSSLESPDCTLWVRATSKPASGPREAPGWGVMDLAMIGARPPALPGLHPGAGLDHVRVAEEHAPRVSLTPPSAISVHVQSALNRGSGGRGDALGAPVMPTGDLLLVPWRQAGAWEEGLRLVSAFESARAAGGTLTVTHGPLQVEMPVLDGVPARVVVGRESTLLVDYGLEIATDTWMPSPVVRDVFDGLCVDVTSESGRAQSSFWLSGSGEPSVLDRDAVGMGRVQLPTRRFRSDRAVLQSEDQGGPHLPAAGASPALVLRFAPGR